MKTGKRKNTIESVLANLAGKSLLAAAAFALVGAGTVDAQLSFDADDTDQFGSWALINQAGNKNDTGGTGHGGVDYEYHIAKHAVSIADWDAFYDDANSQKKGTFEAIYASWEFNVGKAAPVVNVSMYHAAQYANWLTTGNATQGAYTIDADGGVTGIDREYRNAKGMLYALTTEDEWYKAAYFRLDDSTYYADATPNDVTLTAGDANDGHWNYVNTIGATVREVGLFGLEQNDTRNMMGNVWEWMEDTGGVIRGGAFVSPASSLLSSHRNAQQVPTLEDSGIGFRVVAIPEPASGALFVIVSGMVWFVRRRVRA